MPSSITKREIIGALLPFVSALLGISLKFTFIDKYDVNTTRISTFLVEAYLRPAWVDFIVLAYVSGFAAMASQKRSYTYRDLWVYLGFPAMCFVLCIILVVGSPKAGLESDLLQVYLPFVMTAFSLATTGARSVQQD